VSPSQIIHKILGLKPNAMCRDMEAFHCWVCGGDATRGVERHKWAGANFTGQNRVRCAESGYVCESCVHVMAGKPPDTERMWTHLVEGSSHVRVNKGQKPAIRDFIRRTHEAPWFAAIADSGKKHLIPWTPINAPGQAGGAVLFEEAIVELPRDAEGWSMLDDIAELLTMGATKEEILSGALGSRAWQLCGAKLHAFETKHGFRRGGQWFELAIWLAQRDEAAVAERMEAEKLDKAAKKAAAKTTKPKADGPTKKKGPKRERGKERASADADSGASAGASERVPGDAWVQRPEALGSVAEPDAGGISAERIGGGVDDQDGADASVGGAASGQLSLFS
jgi:hypothetical protein